MTGLELQRELAARSITLPVIIITGHSDRQMALMAKRAERWISWKSRWTTGFW